MDSTLGSPTERRTPIIGAPGGTASPKARIAADHESRAALAKIPLNGVSSVLLNWRRPWNLPKIVDSLKRHEFIRQIVIWDNSGHLPPVDGATVHHAPYNRMAYGRFIAAHLAANPLIYTQDDDHVVDNVPELYALALKYPDAIVAGLNAAHHRAEAGKKPWLQLGWGSFFARGSWDEAFGLWVDRYGTDALMESKADRIFSVIHGNHMPVVGEFTRLYNPDGVVSDRDYSSLWMQKGHVRLRDEAVSKALTLKLESEWTDEKQRKAEGDGGT